MERITAGHVIHQISLTDPASHGDRAAGVSLLLIVANLLLSALEYI